MLYFHQGGELKEKDYDTRKSPKKKRIVVKKTLLEEINHRQIAKILKT